MNMTKVLGLAAVRGLLVLAAPAERAQALPLSNPAPAAAIQEGSQQMTTRALPPLASSTALAPLVISGSAIALHVSETGSRCGPVFAHPDVA
jgi:hypothetical protein